MAKVVGVGVTDSILKGVLGRNISINLNGSIGWLGSRSVSWCWCRGIHRFRCWSVHGLRCWSISGWDLGPGNGNGSNSRKGKDLRNRCWD